MFKNLSTGLVFFVIASLVHLPVAHAATATLLTADQTVYQGSYTLAIGNTMYFTASDVTYGNEPWKIDTTTGIVSLVKDIRSGSANSDPSTLVAIGSTFYFSATDGVNGRELWKSDGTENGTVLIKDINPGSGGSSPSNIANVNGTLFFAADDGVNGSELWKSDGTENGTVLVKDIAPGSSKGLPFSSSISRIIAFNDVAFFGAQDGSNNNRLWKSDGTSLGTVAINNSGTGLPVVLGVANNLLLFAGNDGTNGTELWKSDGTDGGTGLVKDIRTGASSSNPGRTNYSINRYFVFSNALYFAAEDATYGEELWKSDGTENGTVLVKDICPGAGASNPGGESLTLYNTFASLGSNMYFVAHDCTTGDELWKSDGTEVGTVLVKDIQVGSLGGFGTSNIFVNNSKLYFAADDAAGSGFELWQSDGTENGTSFVVDINTGSNNGFPSVLGSYGNVLYLLASNNAVFDGTYDFWSYDTTVTAAGGRSYADTTPPDAPTKITTTTDGKSVTLKWSGPAASDVSRIEILRNNGGSSAVDGGTPIDVLKIGATMFTDTAVVPGETYAYIIRPRDATGNLAITDEVRIKVETQKPTETAAPSTPTAPVPTASTPPDSASPVAGVPPVAPPVFTEQDFFTNGTPATVHLGQGEREALWRDYIAIYGAEPTASALDMMATGQVPSVDTAIEQAQAKIVLPYWRAITGKRTLVPVSKWGFGVYNTLIYRIRYTRDLKQETVGIQKFRRVFHRNPSTPVEWASVRAWAYIK